MHHGWFFKKCQKSPGAKAGLKFALYTLDFSLLVKQDPYIYFPIEADSRNRCGYMAPSKWSRLFRGDRKDAVRKSSNPYAVPWFD